MAPQPKKNNQSEDTKTPARTKTAEMFRAADSEPTSVSSTSLRRLSGEMPAFGTPAASVPDTARTQHQKALDGSGFSDSARDRKRSNLIGGREAMRCVFAEKEPTVAAQKFDGHTAPPELTGPDVWKAVQAPLQNIPTRRNKASYEQILKQFAVQTNPRYQEDGPQKFRGHIFVWDVSRAMHCEIPHFLGAKELSLAQTCDWLRHEGPMRGWNKVSAEDVLERIELGHMVVCIPRDIRSKNMGIVPPQNPPVDGVLRLCGAGLVRGWDFPPLAMLGVRQVEFVAHV
jgi:hypothetical protein